ncbi:MAG: YIP1 family protein [Gemmatimonadaceae bacterium]
MSDIDPEVPLPVTPTPEKASLAEDFVDIFFTPRAVFERRANSGFFLVMCVLTLLLGGLYLANRGVMSGIMDAEFARGMAAAAKANPSMTDAQVETAKKFAGYVASFGAFIGIPVLILLVGLGAWITGKILGARLSYSAATMVTAYACIPRIIEALAINAQGWLIDTDALTGRFQLSLGVGRFMDPEMSPGLLGLAGRVDLFTLWVTVLLAIGIGVVGKLPREKAIAAGAIMWVYGALPSLWTLVRG